jgi:V8-like Glu-specific endopeptidase
MRHALLNIVLGLSALAMGCASGGDGEDHGATDEAIVGGTLDSDDPAVVELETTMPSSTDGATATTCTATFISQTVLLTAAHCVVDDHFAVPDAASFRILLTAARVGATDQDWVDVDRANVHPNPSYRGTGVDDVAVLVLGTKADVTPIPILRTPLADKTAGSSVRLVGYGQSHRKAGSHDGAEKKRSLSTPLRRIEGNYLVIGQTGHQACSGDAGGPALLMIDGVETLVATDESSASGKSCIGGDVYQRVELELDFIDGYLKADADTPSTTPPTTGDDDDDSTPAPSTTPPPSPTPPALDGAALYAKNCSSCHGDNKKGSSADRIQHAIDSDKGGMGSLNLTADEIAAIASAP